MPGTDDARTLASSVPDAKALSVEILARMELHKRDRRDIWFSESLSKAPFDWLQETFERVNNGRHPDFTLPRRIELVIPNAVLGDHSLVVTLIDTLGIDDIVARGDLEQHFDDAHTVVVLCTVFNEAPSTSVRQLLTRAKEGGVRTLETNAAILALPRPGEALAVKDNGYPVQNAHEGYEIKGEEVNLRLHPLGLANLPVVFFNAAESLQNLNKAWTARNYGSSGNLRQQLSQSPNMIGNASFHRGSHAKALVYPTEVVIGEVQSASGLVIVELL